MTHDTHLCQTATNQTVIYMRMSRIITLMSDLFVFPQVLEQLESGFNMQVKRNIWDYCFVDS